MLSNLLIIAFGKKIVSVFLLEPFSKRVDKDLINFGKLKMTVSLTKFRSCQNTNHTERIQLYRQQQRQRQRQRWRQQRQHHQQQ